VKIKTSSGFGITKSKPEYEDIARIAQERDISIREVLEEIFGNYSAYMFAIGQILLSW
jgi:uncharacterized protein (DUF111 family)